MSILKPTAGELIDRVTILKLKIETFGKARKSIKAFLSEYREIEEALFKYGKPQQLSLFRNFLQIINSKLWRAEDLIRKAWKLGDQGTAGYYSHDICELNDKRAKVIADINDLVGEDVEEKIYG